MRLSRSRALAVTTTAIAAMLAAGAPPAASQNLFDLLFRNNQAGRLQREAPPPVVEPAQPPAPPRVAGPHYYTYTTDPLVRVNFSAITLAEEEDAALSAPDGIDPESVGSTEAAPQEEGSAAAMPEPETATVAPEPDEPEAPEPETAAAEALGADDIAALQDFALLAEKEAAEAIVAHYSADPRFIWVADGRPNDSARAALRAMGEAGGHGLDPRDYAVSVPASADPAAMAAFEMELSARLLRYVRDARSGRIDPNRISGYHDFKPKELDHAAVLAELHEAGDVAAFLEAQHPQSAHYRALRAELEVLRASAENEIVIAPKTLVKPGQTSAEFPKILALIDSRADEAFRAEHGEVLAQHLGGETYVQALVPVVKAAQRNAGVGDDGVIGPRTIQALAGESKAVRIEKVLVALEQLRWLPSQFAGRHVFINTPAFDATYVENGEERLSMRTIVGGLSTQTYFFQDEIQYVEFHPYWGVPRSILVNKYLPKLYSDPSYLDRAGFEVTDRRGQRVPSASVDWGAYGANIPYDVRQRPGRSNALGEMKIMFPNRHAIYMHDTPDRNLFDRENRALSNGCILLSDPRAMAAAVLGWSRERVDARVAGEHGREDLSVKVPVYVAYFTAWPDRAGEVRYHNDVYSRDEKVRAAIDKVEALRAPGA